MTVSADPHEAMRARAAEAAAAEIESGMVLGYGTGRTAEAFLARLAERVAGGLEVVGVPTSDKVATLARRLGLPVTDFNAHPVLDLTVDGADEVDPRLRLIKGGGGALTREKIVATASRAMLVVVDEGKRVAELGAFPLPVEVVRFGLPAVLRGIDKALARCGLDGQLIVRPAAEDLFVTDQGNHIVDASLGRIPDPERLSAELAAVPGVVEHGLFVNIATRAIIGGVRGVARLTA